MASLDATAEAETALEQLKRHLASPWTPTRRLLIAGFVAGAVVGLLAYDPPLLGLPALSLPFWLHATAWSLSIASITAFALTASRESESDEHLPEPLRSYMRKWEAEAKTKRELCKSPA